MTATKDILDLIGAMKSAGSPFAVATVVRTVSLTAAKAGAKAVIRADGSIEAGWIGGGCARAAVLKAAHAALADGKPRLISVQPLDVLQAQGVEPGHDHEGILFARNACPSQGGMDVFVEPVMPRPELLVCGASPVAVALASLGRRFGYAVGVAAPESAQPLFEEPDSRLTRYDFGELAEAERYIVVSTQGTGDHAALKAALAVPARYVAFVGSRRKVASLQEALLAEGVDPVRLDALHAPAGLAIDAVTPEEIALSILAEIIAVRRQHQRLGPSPP
jgi:xanthine dehydrogenase accessory factor